MLSDAEREWMAKMSDNDDEVHKHNGMRNQPKSRTEMVMKSVNSLPREVVVFGTMTACVVVFVANHFVMSSSSSRSRQTHSAANPVVNLMFTSKHNHEEEDDEKTSMHHHHHHHHHRPNRVIIVSVSLVISVFSIIITVMALFMIRAPNPRAMVMARPFATQPTMTTDVGDGDGEGDGDGVHGHHHTNVSSSHQHHLHHEDNASDDEFEPVKKPHHSTVPNPMTPYPVQYGDGDGDGQYHDPYHHEAPYRSALDEALANDEAAQNHGFAAGDYGSAHHHHPHADTRSALQIALDSNASSSHYPNDDHGMMMENRGFAHDDDDDDDDDEKEPPAPHAMMPRRRGIFRQKNELQMLLDEEVRKQEEQRQKLR